MNKFLVILISLVAAMMAMSGCNTVQQTTMKSLSDYVVGCNFEPFSIPNTLMGPMTIIQFDHGAEAIVASGSDLPAFVAETGSVALPGYDISVTNTTSVNAALDKNLVKNLSLSAVFNDNRVKKIKVQLKNPKMIFVSEVKARTIASAASASVQQVMAEKKNLVVQSVLAVDGIDLTLTDSNDTNIKLDAGVQGIATLSPAYRRQLTDNGTISVVAESGKPFYLGYRPFKVRMTIGGFASGISLIAAEGQEASQRVSEARALDIH